MHFLCKFQFSDFNQAKTAFLFLPSVLLYENRMFVKNRRAFIEKILLEDIIMKKSLSAVIAVMVAVTMMGCASSSKKSQSEAEAEGANASESTVLVEMVSVKGGSFSMGSESGESDEYPVHGASVGSFKMSKTEVTQAAYKKIMKKNPSYFVGENLPVEKVSWYDAVVFCNKLSAYEGLTPCYTSGGTTDTSKWAAQAAVTCNFNANGYRLPTEAEWEYAARGGTAKESFLYAGSDSIDEVAWYEANSENKTHEVGTKNPNSLGLFDMSGNVWEWCWDYYSEDFYRGGSQKDTKGPSSGEKRVLRGGSRSNSYGDGSSVCRVTNRNYANPSERYYLNGFRVVTAD